MSEPLNERCVIANSMTIFSKFTYDGIMGLLGKIKTLLTENVTTVVDRGGK